MSETFPTHVVVLTDVDSGFQALYVGGDLKAADDTIYACDIAEAAGDKDINFSHVRVNMPDGVNRYPERIENALLWISDEK